MRTKTSLMIAVVVLLGAVVAAAAVTKNIDDNKSTSMEGCSSMMEDSPEKHMDDPDHCGNMGDAGSMMGTKYKASAL